MVAKGELRGGGCCVVHARVIIFNPMPQKIIKFKNKGRRPVFFKYLFKFLVALVN